MFGWFRRREKSAEAIPWATDALPESSADTGALSGCRELFGPPPRSLSPSDAESFRLVLSPPLAEYLQVHKDPMGGIIPDQSKLMNRGRVVWGHLVQANQKLFDPRNSQTLPANVIYSLDPYFDGRVGVLEKLALGLYGQKGSTPPDREMRDFVRVITNEVERIMRRELPRGYAGGRSVYFGSFFIQPSHLPANCLTQSSFPMIVNPEETEAVMILPSRYWRVEYASRWRR